ncbi:hypothetical protein PQX77_009881 [Marasmius sp. AFHP31]|nr:hypothetical protein PQX77_009881 [Marasmius sp. AFHP31]
MRPTKPSIYLMGLILHSLINIPLVLSQPQPQATPFNISVPDSEIAFLKQKLELTRLPDELEGAGWDYGAPLGDIKRLVARWKDGYDWKKYEKELNDELPQFTRDIEVDGHGVLSVHYVYKKSERKEGGIPLLFVHGWPGSFIEVRKILPLLTAPVEDGQPSFDVVALSLPGYGFSEGTKRKGFDLTKYAETGHKLMLALGYNEYASVRTYYEVAQMEGGGVDLRRRSNDGANGTIPTGASFFAGDITTGPLSWFAAEFNVVFHSRHDRGGHFAAYEVPELLVDDLRRMYGKGGPAYGVVSGKDGY